MLSVITLAYWSHIAGYIQIDVHRILSIRERRQHSAGSETIDNNNKHYWNFPFSTNFHQSK